MSQPRNALHGRGQRSPHTHRPHMNFELLARQTLTDACSALISPADEGAAQGQSDELCIAAVVGFSGDDLRGTLGVAACAASSARPNPSSAPRTRWASSRT